MPGIEILQDADGGPTTYVMSQSWLNTFQNCPEQARLEMCGQMPRVETDATAIGTAVHAGIETVLCGGSSNEGEEVALATFSGLSKMTEFQWVSIKTPETALETIKRCYWAWWNEVYPQLGNTVAVEKEFTSTLWQGPDCTVLLKGTIDLIDEDPEGKPMIVDWKTANRPYEAWEKERWAIQPTVYSHAVDEMYGGKYDEYEFTYAVMMKSRQDVQWVTVKRDARHWAWLREQTLAIVRMIEAELPMWPLRDQHALCSPKWCPVYAECKGAHF